MNRPLSYLLIFNLLLLILVSSCQPNNELSEEDQLYEEVIQIHDEIMPQMQTTNTLKKRLGQKSDSLKQANGDQGQIIEIENISTQLSEANESMMDWMRNFDPEYEESDSLTRMDYLRSERGKIVEVGKFFDEAINNAENKLKSLN